MSDGLHSPAPPVSVCFLTEPSLQAQAFITILQKETHVPIQLHNIRNPLPEMLPAGTLVLFDTVSANKRLSLFWQNTLRKQVHPIKVLLMNLDDGERGKTLSEWPSLTDIFYRSDTQLHVHARIKESVNKCYSVIHELTAHMFQSQQKVPSSAEDNEPLTLREKQILKKLCEGATNNDIACALFISEHTVRTHIYNLFKKIKVKNRTQAVFWAAEKLEENAHQDAYSSSATILQQE